MEMILYMWMYSIYSIQFADIEFHSISLLYVSYAHAYARTANPASFIVSKMCLSRNVHRIAVCE